MPEPVTHIELGCLTGVEPHAAFEIDFDEPPRLHILVGGQGVIVPFDAVIDAVTQLRDTAKEMQS